MGKLGGGELNFSSDIDLVFLVPEHGETTGPRPLEHEEFFTRVGKRVAQLLGTVTDDGFVYRVDLRLRPFGDSGPLAVSFDALEDYLQEHGRDWERYAYVKARPVFGAEPGFDELYRDVLRPFVYRRYLDFGVFESLRAMKELIAREVERRELQQNVKLGPGGIREIEFIVQAFQLLRGGSTPRLQTRQPARGAAAAGRAEAAERRGRRGAAGRLPLPAPCREPPAGVERRADARAAHRRSRRARASRSPMGLPDWDALARDLQCTAIASARISAARSLRRRSPADDEAAEQALEHVLAPELDDRRVVVRRSAACDAPSTSTRPRAPAAAARERLLPPARRDRPAPPAGAAAAAAARDRAPVRTSTRRWRGCST